MMNRNFWFLRRKDGKAGACAILFLVTMVTRAQPDWSSLERHQASISAETFSRLINEVYSQDAGMISYLRYGPDRVSIYSSPAQTGAPLFELRFAAVDALPPARPGLAGLHIALDPGHIGGAWSRMEERFFVMERETDWPVQEAAMNLHVARRLRDRLAAAGARVSMVKDDLEPVTTTRPDELLASAGSQPPADSRFAHLPSLFAESSQRDAQRKHVERDFYRTAEIAARATLINNAIRPDLTLCIHFNATGYGDEKKLYEENGLAFFVHGHYLASELEGDDQKFYLMRKLLERSHETEVAVASALATAFAAATGLSPAYTNTAGAVMRPFGTNHFVQYRNLAANRQFAGPVVFLEPYFMNNREVYARIQAGDYEGEREINGTMQPSIFTEYVDAVMAGLEAYFGARPAR